MGLSFTKLLILPLFLGANAMNAAKSTSKQNKNVSAAFSKRGSNLTLMYNAWAINPNAINGKGYLKSADTLTKDEYEALKAYLKPIATDSTQDFKEVQNIAQEQANVYGFFNKLEANGSLKESDVTRWKENLGKLHKRLLDAIQFRVGEDKSYTDFLNEEHERSLGNYQVAYAARTSLSKLVSAIDDKNNDIQVELWSQVLKDPHTEMLIRMRQGVEILYGTFLDFERQRFHTPESKILPPNTKNLTDNGDTNNHVSPNTYLRNNQAPFSEGPNPLLPPPIRNK